MAGRLERPEELLDKICGSISGEFGLMRSLAVAAGNDAGMLSCDESDSGVNLRCDELRDDELGDLHGRAMPKSLQLLYCGSLPCTIISLGRTMPCGLWRQPWTVAASGQVHCLGTADGHTVARRTSPLPQSGTRRKRFHSIYIADGRSLVDRAGGHEPANNHS